MALIDNLLAYWKLDEASGDAVDSHGSHTLTDTNTVTAGTGKINGARDFEDANSEYFARTDGDFTGFPTAEMSLSLWVQPETLAANKAIASKWTHGSSSSFILQGIADTGNIRCFVAATAGDTGSNRGDTGTGLLSNGTWTHIVLVYDGAGAANADRLKIYTNGSNQTLSFAGTIPAALVDSTAPFQLGAVTSLLRYWDGLIDECGLWSRALTSGEVTELYNSGNGLAYPFDGGGATGSPWYYELNQQLACYRQENY